MPDHFSSSNVERFDSHHVHRIYEKWPALAREGFGSKVKLPGVKFSRACVLGMGGSAAGGDILASWLMDRPGEDLSVYKGQLPVGTMEGTLAIACSASGETAETIDMLKTAHERGATVVCISGGGSVERVAAELGTPYIKMPEVVAPRYMLPFIVFSCLSVLDTGLGMDCEEEVKEAFTEMEAEAKEVSLKVTGKDNVAKLMAEKLMEFTPTIYGSRLTRGVGIRFKNVLNENSKKHALFDGIPDVFHNEVESWEVETAAFRAVFLRHSHDIPRDSVRADKLMALLDKKGVGPLLVKGRGRGSLAQLLTMAYRLDMASYYMAIGLGRDPFPTAMIDHMKRQDGAT